MGGGGVAVTFLRDIKYQSLRSWSHLCVVVASRIRSAIMHSRCIRFSRVRPCASARVTLAIGLPLHSHISSYFQRRIYKAARVTLAIGQP